MWCDILTSPEWVTKLQCMKLANKCNFLSVGPGVLMMKLQHVLSTVYGENFVQVES